MSQAPENKAVSEELALLRSINHKVNEMNAKVDDIDTQLSNFKKQAALYGAGAGAVSGAIVTTAILAAKFKLGL